MAVLTTTAAPPDIIRWRYLWYVAAATVVMVVAIVSGDLWFLNFIHVLAGVMWTGIDLFMGFIVGPVLRMADPATRRDFIPRLVPRTLFLMPTLSIVTGTTGWFLAVEMGFTALEWPHYGWVAAALVLVGLMTIQGLGYLLPTNLRVCFELTKPVPDHARIAHLMRSYFFVVATQGVMQVVTVVIMARFATGI
jgi:hypothetical protein